MNPSAVTCWHLWPHFPFSEHWSQEHGRKICPNVSYFHMRTTNRTKYLKFSTRWSSFKIMAELPILWHQGEVSSDVSWQVSSADNDKSLVASCQICYACSRPETKRGKRRYYKQVLSIASGQWSLRDFFLFLRGVNREHKDECLGRHHF